MDVAAALRVPARCTCTSNITSPTVIRSTAASLPGGGGLRCPGAERAPERVQTRDAPARARPSRVHQHPALGRARSPRRRSPRRSRRARSASTYPIARSGTDGRDQRPLGDRGVRVDPDVVADGSDLGTDRDRVRARSACRRPTPTATSSSPPSTPPSVASCIDVTPRSRSPNAAATRASGTTVICSNSASARRTTSAPTPGGEPIGERRGEQRRRLDRRSLRHDDAVAGPRHRRA